MTPEEIMALVESIATVADIADQLKKNLASRGWSEQNAEYAAITLTNTMVLKS